MAKSTDLSVEEARVRAAIRAYVPNDAHATVNNPAFYATPTQLTATRKALHDSIIEQYVAKIVKAGVDASKGCDARFLASSGGSNTCCHLMVALVYHGRESSEGGEEV